MNFSIMKNLNLILIDFGLFIFSKQKTIRKGEELKKTGIYYIDIDENVKNIISPNQKKLLKFSF